MEPQKIGTLITQNRELVKSESKRSETIEEQKFAIAIRDKRLDQAEEEELKDCFKYIFLLIGLRPANYPAGGEKEFLHRYIAINFGGHKLAEIRLAFDLAVQGKLNLEPREVNCFENFSVFYFSKIMSAYREFSKEAHKVLEQKKELPAPKEITLFDLACWKLDVIRLTILYEKPKLKPLLTIKQFYARK